MLSKTTAVYATHAGTTLECDIYEDQSWPAGNGPVLLYFHPGGLVGSSRLAVSPWLVQTCFKRRIPLISASYRLLPQPGATGLLEDAKAAFAFAQRHKSPPSDPHLPARPVIAAGGSAGFFLANLLAHHNSPPPAVLLGQTGIPTFQHVFFNSSTQLTPEPIRDEQVTAWMDKDAVAVVGLPGQADSGFEFDPRMLAPDGTKNDGFVKEAAAAPTAAAGGKPDEDDSVPRGYLYDYWLHRNTFPVLMAAVDPGFEWARGKAPDNDERLKAWPPTILIQGDSDPDVDAAVCVHVAECLGATRATLFLAKGEEHLFESNLCLEDLDGEKAKAVFKAIETLDAVLKTVE